MLTSFRTRVWALLPNSTFPRNIALTDKLASECFADVTPQGGKFGAQEQILRAVRIIREEQPK
ncbi:hypothetical protein AUC70_02265 [Methyloceanibacter stevinii]|uniref:Uncharacterized protein n=1 Tax=Methyloceanibacter stevinii TaxID=1774970 RepID=A0A1E3VQC0_9HYPH|nr:hypothetical protein AUC70_02265 [Methyloceanibacter stevinii]